MKISLSSSLATFKTLKSQWLQLLDSMDNGKAIITESYIGQCWSLSKVSPTLVLSVGEAFYV